MRYFGNPTSSSRVHDAMTTGLIDYIDTPAQGNKPLDGVTWCADNGCFSDSWDAEKWWVWLSRQPVTRIRCCAFAVAPDVVADAGATLERGRPWLCKIRELGYPVAYVAQDGFEACRPHWWEFDVLFIGGSTEWKLGHQARAAVAEAKARGKRVHMGRVNSLKRLRYAQAIGCDSVDGTFLTRGPDVNLLRVRRWLRELDEQQPLDFVPDRETEMEDVR